MVQLALMVTLDPLDPRVQLVMVALLVEMEQQVRKCFHRIQERSRGIHLPLVKTYRNVDLS